MQTERRPETTVGRHLKRRNPERRNLRRRNPHPARWLIVKDGPCRLSFLCVDGTGGRVLPVFSFEEEAEMFLYLGGFSADGWRARATSAGELVSVLYGPCTDVRSVALDPLPGMLEEGTVGLVTLIRRRFVQAVLDGGPGGS